MELYAFHPSHDRTAAIDVAIRRSLGDSVAAVLDQASRFGIPFNGDARRWRQSLLAEPAPPRLWACYHDLVQAVVRTDEAAVSSIASELLALLPAPRPIAGSVVTLTEADLGSVDVVRYKTVVDNDIGNPLDLLPATPKDVNRMVSLVVEGRGLLAEVCPTLLDEIDTLGHQIVLATNVGPRRFGGAASVFLWGAVIVNPALVPDRVTLVECLAHETAHALLFGMTLGADLTTNGPAERFASPLRADPRPIEGIVHAVYVLARMNHALEKLRTSAQLDDAERVLIDQKRERNARSYRDGLRTVDEHARFTPEGEMIFKACREAMAEAALV